jgi:hypothetical protein
MRNLLQFGQANAGGVPTWVYYRNADTDAALTQPAITEVGNGQYAFEENWAATSVTAISYMATLNGVDLEEVIHSDQVTAGSVTAGTGAGVNPWLWTAGQIINMAATEMGLAEIADPYASTDPKFIQFRTLLKSAGDEISKAHPWKLLEKECTVTGDGVTTLFALPADFLRMKDGSGWNRSTTFPLGLVSSQQWQALKARTVTGSVSTRFRIQQGRMALYEAPANAASLVYEYVSRYWVATSGAAAADSYFPSAAGDVVMFEPVMVTRLLKAKFAMAKGLDSTGLFAEYAQALSDAINLEPAQVLSLNGPDYRERLVDHLNYPTRLG